MRQFLGLWLGVILLSVPVLAADDDTGKEVSKLVGSWRIVSISSGKGAKEPKDFKLVISEKKMELHAPNGATKIMGYISRINSSTKPKQIDLRKDGQTGFGIYELEGDTLQLIVRDPGQERAREFKGASKGMLFILKRDNK